MWLRRSVPVPDRGPRRVGGPGVAAHAPPPLPPPAIVRQRHACGGVDLVTKTVIFVKTAFLEDQYAADKQNRLMKESQECINIAVETLDATHIDSHPGGRLDLPSAIGANLTSRLQRRPRVTKEAIASDGFRLEPLEEHYTSEINKHQQSAAAKESSARLRSIFVKKCWHETHPRPQASVYGGRVASCMTCWGCRACRLESGEEGRLGREVILVAKHLQRRRDEAI
eukprot:1705725-Pleurochrysis_carterae.AAC.1